MNRKCCILQARGHGVKIMVSRSSGAVHGEVYSLRQHSFGTFTQQPFGAERVGSLHSGQIVMVSLQPVSSWPLTLTDFVTSPETCTRATLLPCLVTCSVCPTCSTRRVEPTSGFSAHAVAQPVRSRPSPCSASLSHTIPSMILRVSLSAATTARGRAEAHRRVRCD